MADVTYSKANAKLGRTLVKLLGPRLGRAGRFRVPVLRDLGLWEDMVANGVAEDWRGDFNGLKEVEYEEMLTVG